jgi:hypothetical protein
MYWSECIDPCGIDANLWKTSTRFEKLKAKRGGMLAYARKYAAKNEQKQVPEDYENVGRFWGVRGWRACGTCHVLKTMRDGGGRLLARVSKLMETAHDEGLVRRVRWLVGDGYCYFVPGSKTLYDIGIGRQLDMILCGEVLQQ